MRRTLALFGAAALAVAGLAGPANASDISAQTDIAFAATGINGTGVTPDTASPHGQAFYDVHSTGMSNEPMGGLNVAACVGPEADLGTEDLITFINPSYTSLDVAPMSGVFRTADPGYNQVSDKIWDAPSGVLYSTTFQLELFNVTSGQVLDITASNAGALHPTCVALLPSQQ